MLTIICDILICILAAFALHANFFGKAKNGPTEDEFFLLAMFIINEDHHPTALHSLAHLSVAIVIVARFVREIMTTRRGKGF